MTRPVRTTSACYPVWLRADIPRSEALAYWSGPHAQIANKIPAMREYLQHHFASDDRGFWPVPTHVGGAIPDDWQIDGMAEVRLHGALRGLWSGLFHMAGVNHDEQNVFDRVVPCLTNPRGGQWWTGPHQPDIRYRAVVFLRARRASRGRRFRFFLEKTLAPGLISGGARELRVYVFQPWSRFVYRTPGVRHDAPINRRYSAAVIIGTEDRPAFNALMASPHLQATQAAQREHCVAIHAYSVARTYPFVLDGLRL